MSQSESENKEFNRQIKEALQAKLPIVEERLIKAFQNEASSKYRELPPETLLKIARPIVIGLINWLDEEDKVIEESIQKLLEVRVKAGYSLADFMSLTTLNQRELQNYCKEIFADQPSIRRYCSTRLYTISSIIQKVELRVANQQ